MDWTNAWPETAGYYWFYGRRIQKSEIELAMVRVYVTNNGVACVCGGMLFYQNGGAESAIGLWSKLAEVNLIEAKTKYLESLNK